MQLIVYFDQNQLALKPFSYLEEKAESDEYYKKLISSNRLYSLGEINSDEDIAVISAKAEEILSKIDVPELWEKTKQKHQNKPVKAQNFADILELELNPENHLAIFLSIHRSKHYFKRKSDQFFPRSAKDIKERQRATKELDNLTISSELILAKLSKKTAKEASSSVEFGETELEPAATYLLQLAADSKEISNEVKTSLKDLLKRAAEAEKDFVLSGDWASDAYRLLKDINYLEDYTEVILKKNQINTKVSGAGKKELQEINNNFEKIIKKIKRKDLTEITCFTIDDSSTKDMDDAISLERNQGGFTLGIHISDVSCLVNEKSELDKIALQQSSSIYTASRIINMFPEELSENLASLQAGDLRPTLSIIYDIGSDYKIKSKKIIPAIIKVSERLSYKQADEMLASEDDFMLNLYQVTIEHETERLTNGAVKMPKQVSEIKMQDGKLVMHSYDEDDFSRDIIAELMIMANSAFAEYALVNFLPAFFRGQEAAEPETEHFKPSFTCLTAKPHSSLGLSAYMQATSPIRRYFDLINQRQIISHLNSKQAVYTRKDLEKIRKKANPALKNVNQASKEAKRYYLLKYLEENHPPGTVFSAEVIKNDKKLGLIRINDFLLTTLIAIPKEYQAGKEIRVKLLEVRPEQNVLRLEETN